MRIRFQLRTDEKDLMISILKEVHEHDPPMENLPTFPSSSQVIESFKYNYQKKTAIHDKSVGQLIKIFIICSITGN